MTTTNEHGRNVLGGIIPNRIDLLGEALNGLSPEHFEDSVQKNIFKFLDAYYQKTGGVLSLGALKDILERGKADPGRIALYEETYEDFKYLKIDDAEFTWALHEVRENYAEKEVRDALIGALKILTEGEVLKDGEVLIGQEPAREFLLDKLSDIDTSMSGQDAPHGEMREEGALILQEYDSTKKARETGTLSGIQFGIPELDEKVGGLQRGDLALSAAYTNDGKTTLCVQMAWSAAVEQGKNVLFLSTETVNTTVRRRMISRHSMHPKFQSFGLPDGLNSKDLKAGTLNPHEEEFFQEVVKDFTDPNNNYGNLYIHQVPRFATMDNVEAIMNSVQKKFDIDLVVCDYLALLRPTGSRNTDRESLSGIIKNAKQIATSFNKGRGVAFISPWQVSRAAWEDATTIGRYTSKALAETAEATNTPDIIVSIIAPVDNTERRANLTAQVLKHRDGETADGIQLTVDYATCHFSGRGTVSNYQAGGYTGASGAYLPGSIEVLTG